MSVVVYGRHPSKEGRLNVLVTSAMLGKLFWKWWWWGLITFKKSLKIPKGWSESVNWKRTN